jgi:hypothetical protein
MADVTDFTTWSSTASSNLPSGTTAVGAGLDDNLRQIQAEVAKWRDGTGYGVLTLTGVAGTNTVVGSTSPAPTLAANQKYLLVPAATNTAATFLNVNSVGNKNVYWNGAACSGGELVISVPTILEYDGTQFNIIGPSIGSRLTASLGADVSLNNVATVFDGPSVAQGTVGVWFASGSVSLNDSSGSAAFNIKLHDGTTTVASARAVPGTVNETVVVHLAGIFTSPTGNIRISAQDVTSTSGKLSSMGPVFPRTAPSPQFA